MKLTLSRRIVGAVIISVLVGSASAIISSFFLMRGFDDLAQKDVEQYSLAVQGQLDGMQDRVREAAYAVAGRPDVAEAVKRGDTAYIQKVSKEVLKSGAVNVLTIAGKDGKVVGRGHSNKAGDSVLGQVNVKKALAGEASGGVEEGTVVKFSMRAGMPLKLEGEIVGSITTGADLSSDTKFVDHIKKIFGIECTIFQGDTRVTTTIVKDGQRAIGTRMDNPKVIETVLQQGKPFQNINTILGREYNTAYWPLRDIEGKIAGMLFVGKDRASVMRIQREMYVIVGISVLVIVVLMALAALFIARSIAGPIQRVSQGLVDSTARVASVSAQVSGSGKVLSEGAAEQAAAIEETSSSLEEMASMTKQNAGNAGQADGLMKQVEQFVAQSNDSIGKLSASMQEITRASEETQKIVKTIDEISFQTNLLALNAAVEAARAGEAGAGFAVVAEEVRNLAKRAAESARNTAGLIDGTIKKVKEGSGLMSVTHESFTQVAGSATQVAELLAEIATASREQSQGIDQVNKAVVDVDKVTQQNAAHAEESAAASEELAAQADQMKVMVNELLAMIGGNAGTRKGLQANAASGRAKDPAPVGRGPVAAARAKQAPASKTAARKGPPEPKQIIPLEAEDFRDF
ncbi:MAG: cache domain-containing protein [Deltaproteobacteria bacterium]|nr:cache domain-containing protein [Deltaproteobacteria bacterium]